MNRWRRNSEESRPVADPEDAAEPWRGGGVIAESVRIGVGRRRRRTVPGVRLTAGEVRAQWRADELRQFATGRLAIVESAGDDPLVYLARVEAIPADSAAGEVTDGLPKDAVVILVAPMTAPPAAVLTGGLVDEFVGWISDLSN